MGLFISRLNLCALEPRKWSYSLVWSWIPNFPGYTVQAEFFFLNQTLWINVYKNPKSLWVVARLSTLCIDLIIKQLLKILKFYAHCKLIWNAVRAIVLKKKLRSNFKTYYQSLASITIYLLLKIDDIYWSIKRLNYITIWPIKLWNRKPIFVKFNFFLKQKDLPVTWKTLTEIGLSV